MFTTFLYSVTGATGTNAPEAKIDAPTKIYACHDLTLSGIQSSGGYGRPLKFEWNIFSENLKTDNACFGGVKTTIPKFVLPLECFGNFLYLFDSFSFLK